MKPMKQSNFSFHRFQVCETNQELSLFIDGTISGFDELREKLESFRVPYFNFDYTLQSVVKILEIFLIQRNALDVVLILTDERAKDEVLRYNLKSESPLRFIVFNQPIENIARRLKAIRPVPDFFTIIGESDKTMTRILKDVSLISNFEHEKSSILLILLMTKVIRQIPYTIFFITVCSLAQKKASNEGLFTRHSERWNIMLLGHSNGEKFESLSNPEMNRFELSHDVCCNPNCICTSHNMVRTLKSQTRLSVYYKKN